MSDCTKFLTSKIKKYQFDAYNIALNYIKSNSKSNALIHLPTGAGKTGVMALVCEKVKKRILIIVPNATLPEQVKDEIEKYFWIKVGVTDKDDINICILNQKNSLSEKLKQSNTIFVSTIQFLQKNSLNSSCKSELSQLINDNIDCIFFDEGHREPAIKWRKFINTLTCKLILFTATPYRNDNAVFKIDKDYLYTEKMQSFIDRKDISDIEFKSIKAKDCTFSGLKSSSNETDDYLLNIVDSSIKNNKKVLIRCEKPKEIERLTKLFNENGIKTLGCHSMLSKSQNLVTDGGAIKEIADKYSVFIHCEMMIEGINLPEIKTLVFLDTFSNLRSNIQQIGRTLRNAKFNEKSIIYLPDDIFDEFSEQWEYLKDYCFSEEKYTYLGGKLKKVIENRNEITKKHFLIPQKANIYYSKTNLFNELSKNIMDMLGDSKSCEQIFLDKNENYIFVCYKEKTYSPHFKCFTLENTNVHICMLYKYSVKKDKEYYYFYYNSDNSKLFDEEYEEYLTNEEIKNFQHLLHNDAGIIQAKYERSNAIYSKGIKGREVIGKDIGNTPVTLEQKMSFIRSAKSKSNNMVRYINTITSRVSDRGNTTIDNYMNWCKKIVDKLTNDSEQNIIFNRFSRLVRPIKSTPNFIVVDFGEEYAYINGELADISFSSVIENNEFVIKHNELNYKYLVEFNEKNSKYSVRFVPSEFDSNQDVLLEYNNHEISKGNLINKSDFRLYFLKEQVVYIKGKYYSPNINTTFKRAKDWDLYKNIEVIDGLNYCLDEKTGKETNQNLKIWSVKSVFGVIYRYIENNEKNIEYLICDDMGSEIADFIALDTTNNKIVYIHCKHSKSSLSASDFQDVCGQAMKNIRYIINSNHSDNRFMSKRKEKWSVEWPYIVKPAKVLDDKLLINRVKKFTSNDKIDNENLANEAHLKYNKMFEGSDVKYEIWLVHSGLSKEELTKNLLSSAQSEQTAQLIWLLQSTNDYLNEAGATLKVFCKS